MSMSLINIKSSKNFQYLVISKIDFENLNSDSCSSKAGKTLPFFKGVHFEAKKLLKLSAFLLKSGSNLSFIASGGISGTFFPLQNVF